MSFKIKQLTPLIGLCLLGYILYKIDLGTLLMVLKSTNISFLILACINSLLTLAVMNIRWYLIIRALKMKISYIDCFYSLAKGTAIGMITPGKVGELYRAKYLMEKTKKSAGISFSTVVVDRILDLLTLVILGMMCTAIFINIYLIKLPFLTVIVSSVIIILVILFSLNKKYMQTLFLPLLHLFASKKLKKRLDFHFNEFYRGVKSLDKYTVILGFVTTLLMWFMSFVTIYLLSLSIGLNLPFWFVIIMGPIISFVNLIPISISGFGTVQAACIFLLGIREISPESAVALSFLIIFVGIWIYALPGAILYALKK